MVQQSKKIVFARSLAPFCFQIYLDELQVVLNSTPAFAELTRVAIRGMRFPIDPEEDRRFFDTLASLSVIPLAVRRGQDMWVGIPARHPNALNLPCCSVPIYAIQLPVLQASVALKPLASTGKKKW